MVAVPWGGVASGASPGPQMFHGATQQFDTVCNTWILNTYLLFKKTICSGKTGELIAVVIHDRFVPLTCD